MSKKEVLSKFMILCWATFIANPQAMDWTPLLECGCQGQAQESAQLL